MSKNRYKNNNSPNHNNSNSQKSNTSFVSSNSPDKLSPGLNFNVNKIIHITN